MIFFHILTKVQYYNAGNILFHPGVSLIVTLQLYGLDLLTLELQCVPMCPTLFYFA